MLFQNSLIINYLMFLKSVHGFDISTTTDTWDNAANHCSDNQLYKVKDNVLDDLDPHMSPGDVLWVGARAKLTHYVSWDGCWKINVPIAKNENIFYNSLASCLDYCNKYTRIALQNEVCSCISDVEGRQYLGRAPTDRSYCNNRCNGNMNDICGGADSFVSLYTRHYEIETITSTNGRCLAVIPRTLTWRGTHCDDTSAMQGYLCEKTNTRKQAINNSLPWDQAFRECVSGNGQMKYLLEKSSIGLPTAFYWTSFRQSSAIHWQSKSDEEYPLCVSIMKTQTQYWMLQEEDCNIKHRFICDDEVLSSLPVWAIVFIVCVVILVCVVTMVTFILWRKKRKAKVRTSSFGNQFYHDIIPSVSQTSTGRQHQTRKAVNNNGDNKHYSNIYNTIESQENSDSEADNKGKNNGGKDDATQQSKKGSDKNRAQTSHQDNKTVDINQRITSAYECVDVGENTYNTAGFGMDNKFTSKPNSESNAVPSDGDQYGTTGVTGINDNDNKDQGTSNTYAVFNMAGGAENEYNTTSFVPRENHSVDKIYDKLKLEEGQ